MYRFPENVLSLFTQRQRDTMRQQRDDYNSRTGRARGGRGRGNGGRFAGRGGDRNRGGNSSDIQSLVTVAEQNTRDIQQLMRAHTGSVNPPVEVAATDNATQISQVSQGSMMGGRNDQARQRSNANRGN
jgi:hypothetical protein